MWFRRDGKKKKKIYIYIYIIRVYSAAFHVFRSPIVAIFRKVFFENVLLRMLKQFTYRKC